MRIARTFAPPQRVTAQLLTTRSPAPDRTPDFPIPGRPAHPPSDGSPHSRRAGNHPRPANAIIERVMHVTVNPHVGQLEQRPEVTHERSVDRVIRVAWMHRRRRNAVMGYHDGAALERFCQFVSQPAERLFVLRQRLPWPEPLIVADPDHTMVMQRPPGQRHAPVAHAIELIIGPEATTGKPHITDDKRVALKVMHRRAGRESSGCRTLPRSSLRCHAVLVIPV